MTVLVETSVWSLAYRRRDFPSVEQPIIHEFAALVRSHRAVMVGPVRQEVLACVRDARTWELLRSTLRAFEDLPLDAEDFELAAEFSNQCRSAGIQGSPVDFIICAVSHRYETPIFTTDGDFENYAQHLDITLHKPS